MWPPSCEGRRAAGDACVPTETCAGRMQRAPPGPGQQLNAPPSHTWDKTKQIHKVARILVLTSHGQNVYMLDFADLRKYSSE